MQLGRLIVLFALLASPASAQEPVELSNIQLDPINASVSALQQNQVIYLQNYYDGILPDPMPVLNAVLWYDGPAPLTQQTYGNIAVAIDPGCRGAAAAGTLSGQQLVEPPALKTLLIWESFPEQIIPPNPPGGAATWIGQHGSRQAWREFAYPFLYHSGAGDCVGIEPEIVGGGMLNTGLFISVTFMSPVGDILPVPANPPPWTLYSGGYDNAPNYPQGVSLRSVVPGPTVPAPNGLFRVHLTNTVNTTPPTIALPNEVITHVSACPQLGATSTCASPPVELKINHQSGKTLAWNQMIWTDWTPMPLSIGQNALVTISMFGGGTSYWVLNSISGHGSWATVTDSWNTAAMQDTIVTEPATWTYVVDRAQVQ